MAGAKGLRRAEISLSLLSDAKMRAINKQWRGKDSTTDVLSFPLLEARELAAVLRAGPEFLLGDVVIALGRAKEQALEHGVSLRQELDLLLVHGILHLLGLDHEISPKEARRMLGWERKLLGHKGLIR